MNFQRGGGCYTEKASVVEVMGIFSNQTLDIDDIQTRSKNIRKKDKWGFKIIKTHNFDDSNEFHLIPVSSTSFHKPVPLILLFFNSVRMLIDFASHMPYWQMK